METNMATETKPDRKMWFSMWFLGAIASFGVAFFPFFYYSVDRRNRHLQRQNEFERKVANSFHKEWTPAPPPNRNARLWAASIVLIVPVFAIAYLLSKDLNEHEKRQQDFLAAFYPERKYVPQWVFIRTCAIITVATLGVGMVYWLYKIVNLYNNHFKEQYHIEHELTTLMEAQSHVEPL
jgi:hypothetical protein